MKKLYFLIGYPASGKTTLAKKMHMEKGFEYVSSDEVFQALYDQGYKYSEICKKRIPTIVSEILNKGRNANNIVLDIYAPFKHERIGILKALPDTYIGIAVVMNTSKEECIKRFNTRGKWKKDSLPEFANEIIEEPTIGEFHQIISSDDMETIKG